MILFDYKSSELFSTKKSYKLSSVLGEDNFYFGLFEMPYGVLRQAKFISGLPENYFLDVKRFSNLLDKENLLNSGITHGSFAYQSPYFSIVPDGIAENSPDLELARDISELYQDERYRLAKIPLPGLDSSFCFMESVSMVENLSGLFPSFRVSHLNVELYNRLKANQEQMLVVHFFDQSMQTILLDKGHLVQTNDYTFRSVDDILYYTLHNLNNNGIDPSNARIYVSGMISEEGPALELLRKHIRFVELTDHKHTGQYSNVFLGKQKSYFFSLECLGYADHQR